MDFISLTHLSIGVFRGPSQSLPWQIRVFFFNDPRPVLTRQTCKKSTDTKFLLQFPYNLQDSLRLLYKQEFAKSINTAVSSHVWNIFLPTPTMVWLLFCCDVSELAKLVVGRQKNYNRIMEELFIQFYMRLRYVHYPKSLWFWKI